jgi:dUTP pyrophosphatase
MDLRDMGKTPISFSFTIGKAKKMTFLKFVKITENATTPTKGSPFAAGYDLYSAADVTVLSQDKASIPTDLRIRVPDGTYGRIAPRSGLAVNHFIDVGAGVIDIDYCGPVFILLYNHGPKEFKVKKGDRVAQLICEKIENPKLLEIVSLDPTKRNEGGFGSTGESNEACASTPPTSQPTSPCEFSETEKPD